MDALNRTSTFVFRPQVSMPADNTRVALKPVMKKSPEPSPASYAGDPELAKMIAKNPPRQTYLSQGHAMTKSERAAADARRLQQENYNAIYQSDPLAAQINGLRNFGSASQPDVQKIGPTVLEGTALMHPGVRMALGGIQTVEHVAHTVEDPSLSNILLSAVEVAATASGVAAKATGVLAESKIVHTLAHNPVLHGLHTDHDAATVYEAVAPVAPEKPEPAGVEVKPPFEFGKSLRPAKLDVGPTIRNLEIKNQVGAQAWEEMWKQQGK